ncbi:hypothetical protein DL93DRAFT_2087864 [Clavulina sp. PMI_390]|nr:hypothetical protein DL93DRAFT_2087864 [Clavulina sp. PMI_390]
MWSRFHEWLHEKIVIVIFPKRVHHNSIQASGKSDQFIDRERRWNRERGQKGILCLLLGD